MTHNDEQLSMQKIRREAAKSMIEDLASKTCYSVQEECIKIADYVYDDKNYATAMHFNTIQRMMQHLVSYILDDAKLTQQTIEDICDSLKHIAKSFNKLKIEFQKEAMDKLQGITTHDTEKENQI